MPTEPVSPVIDLRDRSNPPPDDPVSAPYGHRWDTKSKEWVVKRSAGGRKSGAAWLGKIMGSEPDADPVMQPFEEQFDYVDPEPAHLRMKTPRVPRTAPARVNKKVKDDIAGACGLVGMLVLPPLAAKDPYCGQALTENFGAISEALVPLLCKSSTVVNFFTDDRSDWMLWFKLAMALAPVGMAVGRHHILRTVEIREDAETGDLYAVPRNLEEYSTEEVPAE